MTSSLSSISFFPPGTPRDAKLLLAARALRGLGDGYVSLLLPFYLTLLGYSAFEVGLVITATLLGSGALTLSAGFLAHRFRSRSMLRAASLLMIGTGIAIVLVTDFWPLLIVAFVGTLNPATGDVSVFAPIEHALLAQSAAPRYRTALFARYSLAGSLVGALGALSAGLPMLGEHYVGLDPKAAMQIMFLGYALLGLASLIIYRTLSPALDVREREHRKPLVESRATVFRLAALFSLDSFAGGFAVQSLIALWLYQRFGLSLAVASTVFFWVGILMALSQLVSVKIAERIGLVNTMVYTHLPANVMMVLVPFMPNLTLALTLLFLRSALSQMDVPARTSYVMAVVTPGERAAAASVTAVPRSLATAVSPTLAGYLLAVSSFGWPLVICGGLKIVYDLLLLRMFSALKPPEERD
jgi:MFS family permease